MLRILVSHGYEEQVFPLPEGEARLGSAPENEISLRVKGVSRRHALLRRCPEGVEIIDQGSRNKLFVGGGQVERAILTPGLRVQIGMAWLEVEEVSSSAKALAALVHSSEERASLPLRTAAVEPGKDPRTLSPDAAALALAYHVAERGAGVPGQRADLLLRIKATLGAEALATFDRRLHGKLRPWESEGRLLPGDIRLFDSLALGVRTNQAILKRAGRFLIAGRDSWFLGAKFAEESLAQEGWRKDLLRFLGTQLFRPIQSLDDLDAAEAERVLALTRGNKKKTAELLHRARGTLKDLLARRASHKS
jgi:hypothetical protein